MTPEQIQRAIELSRFARELDALLAKYNVDLIAESGNGPVQLVEGAGCASLEYLPSSLLGFATAVPRGTCVSISAESISYLDETKNGRPGELVTIEIAAGVGR